LHLVLGDEELLIERAVAEVLRSARKRAGAVLGGISSVQDVPVSRMRAGDVDTYELAELLSPSLFADERIVVLEAAAEAGKDAAALIASAAADIPPGTVLVVVHSGGGRAKALANELQSGALPIKLVLISRSQVSATLGKTALNQGLIAMLAGFAVVCLFLLIFYRVLGAISDYPIPLNAGIFGLLDRRVLGSLNNLGERNRYFPGLRAWVGYRTAVVYYDRQDRVGGERHVAGARALCGEEQ